MSLNRGANRRYQLSLKRILQQIALRAGFQSAQDVALVGMHAQDHDGGCRICLSDLEGGFNAVQIRHPDVHHQQVGLQRGGQSDGLTPIVGFAHHGKVGLLLDEEMLRFSEVIDEVGPIDSVAAVRLYQAEYSLEAAR